MQFSNRLNTISEYIFSRLEKKVKKIESTSGRKVLNLSIGSPTFPPAEVYLNRLKEIIAEPNIHLYPGYNAIPEFKTAIKKWYKRRFRVDITDEEIFPLFGSKDAISHLPIALINKEDEVLTPDPGYPAFAGSVLLAEGKPVYYDLLEKNEFKVDIKELEKLVNSKTKFIWVNFPSNPTGQVIDLSELNKIVDFCLKYKIRLIYDNAYSEITFDGYKAPSILQINKAKEIAIEIGSLSKTFSFAGFRIGWAVGNKDLINALAKIKSQIDSGLPLVWQKLAAFALTNFDQKWYKAMIKEYQTRRDIIAPHMRKLDLSFHYPLGSLYLWAKIPDGYKDSEEFVNKILEKYQVLLAPGSAFGKNGDRYVRISICSNINNIDSYLKL